MTTATLSTPVEIDTAIAEKWAEVHTAEQRVAYATSALLSIAGAKYYYRGHRRVTDTTIEEAVEIANTAAVEIDEYKTSHVKVDGAHTSTDWSEYKGRIAAYDNEKPAKYLAEYAERIEIVSNLLVEVRELGKLYTGWSRFFLVTSSQGHIHSNMDCSSCRPTTTYGWLPELSGQTEKDAVEAHGPALCSFCFPSAPTEWTQAKITKANAEKAAH